MAVEPAIIYAAVIEWTGYGEAASPARDVERLVSRFGAELAGDLIGPVKALYNDYYRSSALRTSPDLASMAERSLTDFKALRPEVPDEVGRALAWCCTWDFR